MNIVRNRRLSGFGQADIADSPIFQDIQTPQTLDTSVSDFPMYNDPGLITAENVSAAQASQAAAAPVPKPPSSFTFNLPAISSTPSMLSPAPRVNIPLTTTQGFLASSLGGIPTIAWLGIALIGVLALSGGGRRR